MMSDTPRPDRSRAALEPKAERVLAFAYHGIHHVPYWRTRKFNGCSLYVTLLDSLATFDANALTRLVVAAHDEGIRLEILPAGPHYLKVGLSLRQREGEIWDRHPTMEQHLAALRAGGRA